MAIELMNVKGNITLGGEISGQVELDNTITEEIKDVLNSCKHIETINTTTTDERTEVDLWDLKAGIYYFNDTNEYTVGFKIIMDKYQGQKEDQYFYASHGNVLIISGYYDNERLEAEKIQLFGNIERSFLFIGSPNTIYGRAYIGKLTWMSMDDSYSGYVANLEETTNKVKAIDPEVKKHTTYPTEKAVVDYVSAAIAGIEIPEATGGITEITEDTFAYDLPTGVYKINSNGDYCLYADDGMWPQLLNGVVIINNNMEISGEYNFIFIGMDDSWVDTTWIGKGIWNGEWHETIEAGNIESNGNKRNNLINPNFINGQCYPTTQAVVDYINSKLVPIEIDVGSEHADNEYYNANAVDAVLIEVVGLVEEMMEYIETFAIGLDELNARVEALENK